jgi:hypothetical protein
MARNSWESYQSCYKKASDFIEQLNIDPDWSAFYDILHRVIWHDGFDPVRWIIGNHDLIEKISKYEEITNIPEETWEEIKISLNKLIRR